jgi:aminoglycoside 6'-N-acetyltransferase
MSNISFRKLEQRDLSMLQGWLNAPHIQGIYEKAPVSMEEVEEKYNARILENARVKSFVILHDDKPIGYIQAYRVSDDPRYEKAFALPYDAAGIDLFIGEKEYVGKGLGSNIIKKFTKEVVFSLFDVEYCIADPGVKNTPSMRAFEKAGFKPVKTIIDPEDGSTSQVVALKRF